MPDNTTLDTWAVVEVMGHKRFAGHVTEQLVGPVALIRVDVPETEQPGRNGNPATVTAQYTKLIGAGSIYMITPCTEEVARRVATELERYNDPIPVALPETRQLVASTVSGVDFDIDDEAEF